jgi:hypothetical protein
MSTTSIQTVATTVLDFRDIATVAAALTLYQSMRAAGPLPPDVASLACGEPGTDDPLSHQETNELLDLIDAADTIELATLGSQWDETRNDLALALAFHEGAQDRKAQPAQIDFPVT